MRILLTAAFLAVFSGPAIGHDLKPGEVAFTCATAEYIEAVMMAKNREPRFRAVVANGRLLEVWVSPDARFNVFVRGPGVLCPLGSGEGWQAVPPLVKGDPS